MLSVVCRAEASSPEPKTLLRLAERQYHALDYEVAVETLQRVLTKNELSRMDTARALLYLGVCYSSFGKRTKAVAAFSAVLARRPDFRLPRGVAPHLWANYRAALIERGLPMKPYQDRNQKDLASTEQRQGTVSVGDHSGVRPLLAVDARPHWAVVWVDDELVGHSPLQVPLKAGKHKVVVSSPRLNEDRTFTITSKPRTKTKIVVKWTAGGKKSAALFGD